MRQAPATPVIRRLRAGYPRAATELDHADAYQLLVATVLSAQTTDVRVNAVTPRLFARWPAAVDLAGADEAAVEDVVRSLGMGATRARRIIGLAAQLVERHGGNVPDDQGALEALPGVGRKTAYVVRGVWFGHPLLAVDTHVTRVAGRLGWSSSTRPETVERDVSSYVAAARDDYDVDTGSAVDLTWLSLALILHGRRVCTARNPACPSCDLRDLCPSARVERTGGDAGGAGT